MPPTKARQAGREFSPTDPDLIEDPYTVYREARERCPVHHVESMGMYAVLSWDGVTKIVRQSDALAGYREREIMRHGAQIVREPYFEGFADFVILKDGEDHSRVRKSFARHLTPPRVEALRAGTQAYAETLVAEFAADGRAEIHAAYARKIPVRTISDLLGVPLEDYPRLERWLADFKPALNFVPMTREEIDACNAAVEGLRDYFLGKIAERRERPGGDLLSAMIAETEAGNLTEVELATNAYVLYFAGHDTTADMIANGIEALCSHPDQLDLLRQDPGLWPQAVHELLRLYAPGQANIRTMPTDIELDGTHVPAGCPIAFYFPAANRDPKRFDHPDTLDITRPLEPNLTFSKGPHVCPGRHLAPMTVGIAWETLVRKLAGLRLAPGRVEWSRGIQTRGPVRLNVEWDPPA